MERIKGLVNKLQDQLDQNAEPSLMLATVQMLHAELLRSVSENPQKSISSKVAIVMPQAFNHIANHEKVAENIVADAKTGGDAKKYIVTAIEPVEEEEEKHEMTLIERDEESFDPMIEVPTLSHHQEVKEIKDKVPVEKESLNDRLRQSSIELGEVLKETPVKDLKKAIGINDRFTFINELFRGDETMYERSIKTINSFNIYAEAEYWINRELIVKLGWNNNDENVKLFTQLVKRRFS